MRAVRTGRGPRRPAAAPAVAVVLVVLLGGCSGTAPVPTAPTAPKEPTAARPDEAPPGPVALAAVGDSITEADSPDFARGDLGPASWVSHAVGEDVAFAGGWAEWGATTAQMAAGVEPVPADVLVVLAGTNDVTSGVPFAETADNLRQVAATVGAPEVVLCAVPPIDNAPELAERLNDQLAELAGKAGWTWVDAPAGLRAGDRFAPGMASDGVHPTTEGAAVIGAAVREAVLELSGSRVS
ncbi:SGNH/GDSL hydrolase family protein [Georgenia sp. TF02-10]|uniref:SGNH/GDSL hydrolase family protein n=1 Tax=Georgenia sp. TF02-10 TaxID=2917725 RepID=UPI001FA808A2|nr:SGNH/GDSL hydrolase family protein [Georgenia sp. TF02-10]UNX53515.1 SGNH/GDSL hydrolase family protein [Georgenia sp. TF02-10]